MIKKQITFNGTYCEEKAIEWLRNLEKCFHIKKVVLKSYKSKQRYIWQGDNFRCKLVVEYE